MQFGLAAAVSPLVGLGGERTALPMTVTMAASSVVAGAAVLFLARSDAHGDDVA
ncbi:hypothetical protein [Streptomyces sp. ID05-47C]|uniref:hypothetical protein n=1 Tax=Streptomyces sp. ID05-47C TaxID=3028665 RepID=UPI0029A8B4E0|nr:hypothetical protein [Streptomyces sp. ID05-47C]MDX3568655.1 hypothetical protein [Streptomyces sp. ID05-47C]